MSRFLHPDAQDADRLAAVCMVHDMFFFLDDLFFDTDRLDPREFGIDPRVADSPASLRQYLGTLLAAFSRAEPADTATALHRAFAELGGYILSMSNAVWLALLVSGIQDYLRAALDRFSGAAPSDLPEFLRLRLRDTGGLHTCQLIEFASGRSAPSPRWSRPEVTGPTAAAIGMASLVNDVYSYHKDVIVEGSHFNLVSFLMRAEHLTFAQAIDRSVKLINSYTATFAQTCAHEADAEPYHQGLAAMMAGNLHWHRTSPRY